MASAAGLLPPHVLVVDDNAELREMIAAALVEQGLRTTEAGGEEEAMRLVAARRFDAAVIDLGMPGVGAVLLLARFRGMGNGRDLPAVVMSSLPQGSTRDAVRAQACQFSCIEFVDKPVTGRRLLAALNGLLATA